MAVRILYFAWVREAVGLAEEVVDPGAAATVGALLDRLAREDPGREAAFVDREQLRIAVDQVFAGLDAPIADAREIAVFPPVTGG